MHPANDRDRQPEQQDEHDDATPTPVGRPDPKVDPAKRIEEEGAPSEGNFA